MDWSIPAPTFGGKRDDFELDLDFAIKEEEEDELDLSDQEDKLSDDKGSFLISFVFVLCSMRMPKK